MQLGAFVVLKLGRVALRMCARCAMLVYLVVEIVGHSMVKISS